MLACLSLGAYTTYLMVNDNAQKKAQKVIDDMLDEATDFLNMDAYQFGMCFLIKFFKIILLRTNLGKMCKLSLKRLEKCVKSCFNAKNTRLK